MRLLKKHDKINFNKHTEKIEPYRSFYLTEEECEKIRALPADESGLIFSSKETEELLKDILDARGMGSLLYPPLERDDWSGYVKLLPDGLFWML
jgi:hypothetical protein